MVSKGIDCTDHQPEDQEPEQQQQSQPGLPKEDRLSLVIHHQGSDGDGRCRERVYPGREKELHPGEGPELNQKKQGNKSPYVVEQLGKLSQFTGNLQVGDKPKGGWCHHDKKGGYQFFCHGLMEKDAVERNGLENNPEKQPKTEIEPGYFQGGMLYPDHRHNNVANDRNKP